GPGGAYLGFVIMGIGASVLAPTAFSLVGQLSAPEARARAVARATQLGYLGYFLGPPLLGLIAGTFGLRLAFGFSALAGARTVPGFLLMSLGGFVGGFVFAWLVGRRLPPSVA
ncbi:MAG: hypothetical protein ACK4MT_02325, partial [Thermaurantiacus tibetensis]